MRTQQIYCLLLAVSLVPVLSIYVDHGNPYEAGKLDVSSFFISTTETNIPQRTLVYHPSQPGDYGVVFFISGLGGFIPSFIYDNHLANVSSHGYIAVSSAFLLPFALSDDDDAARDISANASRTARFMQDNRDGENDIGDRNDEYWKVLTWLQENLQAQLSKRAASGVMASFDHVAYSCHSAGCREIYELITRNTSLAQAVTFIEPYVQIPAPNNFYLPGLMIGTELGDEQPSCSQPGRDFRQNYDNWACPRVLGNVKGHGHCDILSPLGWHMCRLINFCKTEPDTDLNRYHMFLQGYTSAFYGTYLQGNKEMLKYVTDREMIPMEFIEYKVDVKC